MRAGAAVAVASSALVTVLAGGVVVGGPLSGSASAAEPPPSPCGAVPLAPYVDLDRGSPHAPAIDCALWLGVVRGTEPDVFAPGAAVRRDQMAVLVARAVTAAGGELPPPEDRFSDLDGNVHRDAIGALAAAGIVTGHPDGTYRPRDLVPRGQMTAFLARAWEHLAGAGIGDAPDAFSDDDGHRYERTIDQLAARGIVAGRTATTFAPDDPTTRAGTATFLVRLVGDHWGADRAPATGGFTFRVEPLPGALRTRMTGSSWREGCPVGLDELRLVQLVHRGMDGRDRWGLLVLRGDTIGRGVARALGEAHAGGFAIERMQLVDRFGADDDASMAANNTSAFNCRTVEGSTRWSRHAYGDAIDVNPVQNPYVRGDEVEPPAGRDYLDRSDVRPGMIVRPGALLPAFEELGWGWGGDWSSSKDYQHLSATGT